MLLEEQTPVLSNIRTLPSRPPTQGRSSRNVLIVGSNRRAVTIADYLIKSTRPTYRVEGFVDDLWHFDDAPDVHKQMLIGSLAETTDLLRLLAIDEVMITLPLASAYLLVRQIVETCSVQGIAVRCADPFDAENLITPFSSKTTQLITIRDCARKDWMVYGKRLMDLFVSAVALAILLPILALVALAIKVTSPGPVIFSQERLGKNKHPFRIFKFRTMVSNAESMMNSLEHLNESDGPHFKLRRDPRITRIGAFLRKTSLDELPQLFNVLIGDMSLVGPRPIVMRDYLGISKDWQRRRFSVKPGVTCLWQVSGRSTISFDRWMQLDIDYIDHWSVWLDVKILMWTVPAVIRGSGAM
jgi:exopolysaccharide biosynthesis polyprenyl glycosylphosphotransferase